MLSCIFFGLTPVYAQSVDTAPPSLQIDTIEEADRLDAQVFTATVTDNQAVGSVVLFYRFDSETEFVEGVMSRIGNTDRFSFIVPRSSVTTTVSAIQYYVEAKDEAGNRVLEGFSFDPLERLLLDSSATVASDAVSAESESSSLLGSMSTGQKIVIGLAGIIVVGALVSAGDSSSGGGGDGPSGPTVPVTIISEPFNATR